MEREKWERGNGLEKRVKRDNLPLIDYKVQSMTDVQPISSSVNVSTGTSWLQSFTNKSSYSLLGL